MQTTSHYLLFSPCQTLAIDPCFYFGEQHKGILAGPLPIQDDLVFVPKPVDTNHVSVYFPITGPYPHNLTRHAFLPISSRSTFVHILPIHHTLQSLPFHSHRSSCQGTSSRCGTSWRRTFMRCGQWTRSSRAGLTRRGETTYDSITRASPPLKSCRPAKNDTMPLLPCRPSSKMPCYYLSRLMINWNISLSLSTESEKVTCL